nr:hypothetical protein Cry52Nrm2_p169 [Cryptomonas curvata]
MIKRLIEFIKEHENCSTEVFRYELGIEYEISDKLIKILLSIKNIIFQTESRRMKLEYVEILRNKSDLICFIKNSTEGITIYNLIDSYLNVKLDLIDLVKYKEKDRILILIKGKSCLELTLFPFNNINYIGISSENIVSWYRIPIK